MKFVVKIQNLQLENQTSKRAEVQKFTFLNSVRELVKVVVAEKFYSYPKCSLAEAFSMMESDGVRVIVEMPEA